MSDDKDKKVKIEGMDKVDKDGKKEKIAGKCVGSGKASEVVAIEFDYAGRTSCNVLFVSSFLAGTHVHDFKNYRPLTLPCQLNHLLWVGKPNV